MLYYLLHTNHAKSEYSSVNIRKVIFICKISCFNEGNFLSAVEPKFLEEKFGWAIAPAAIFPLRTEKRSLHPTLQLLHLNPRHFQHDRSNWHESPHSGVSFSKLLKSARWRSVMILRFASTAMIIFT